VSGSGSCTGELSNPGFFFSFQKQLIVGPSFLFILCRLFTAADSDDISTAIEFINKARPWTTLMGVGWGYGANMLTKYLAESGEKTPLTAATCIDNPFDLEEATRSSPHSMANDQKLTGGLIDILRYNKVNDCFQPSIFFGSNAPHLECFNFEETK
jgi:hypothetical protein